MNVSNHQQAKNATSSNPKLPNLNKKCAIRKATRKPGASAARADLTPEVRNNVYNICLHRQAGRSQAPVELGDKCVAPERSQSLLNSVTLIQASCGCNSRRASQPARTRTKTQIHRIIHRSAHGHGPDKRLQQSCVRFMRGTGWRHIAIQASGAELTRRGPVVKVPTIATTPSPAPSTFQHGRFCGDRPGVDCR